MLDEDMMELRQCIIIFASANAFLRAGLTRILQTAHYNATPVKSLSNSGIPESLLQGSSVFLIVDASDDFEGAVDQIESFKRRYPDSRVAVLVGPHQLQIEQMLLALRSGANAYLTNFATPEAFINSLELVMLGEAILPMTVLADLINQQRGHVDHGGSCPPHLSGREMEIVRCLIQGNPNKVIARKLQIADATVKVHVKAILRKMGVANRTQVAIWAMRNGVLTSTSHDVLSDKEEPPIQRRPNVAIVRSPSLPMSSALERKKPLALPSTAETEGANHVVVATLERGSGKGLLRKNG
jgi:DNA-binding NarL/FixJ family response regulator